MIDLLAFFSPMNACFVCVGKNKKHGAGAGPFYSEKYFEHFNPWVNHFPDFSKNSTYNILK